DINVVEPTDDCVLAFPLEHMNVTPGSWGTRYYVTEETSVMDTIGDVPFAERVDTLLAHIEIASNATWEIIWVDGAERVDLKIGDIFKVIAGDGATAKEYYIDVNDYNKNDNALLASITWPDMPGFISDAWIGDTIPGFSPTSSAFNIVLPYGTVNVPALVAKAQDVNAVVDIDRAISLGGGQEERTTIFTVTAESDTTESIYKVTFVVEKDYSNLQPYSPEPFFSEIIARQKASGCAIEIVNSGNTPLFLDQYMIVQSDNAKNAVAAITQWGSDSDTDYTNRFGKYVPGFKYTKDTAEWRANPEFLIPDPNVDPYVAPGEVFVMMKLHTGSTKVSPDWEEADIIMSPHESQISDPLVHPVGAWNPWDEIPSSNNNAAEVYQDNHFLFKIVGDSIMDGEKGLSDPEDFELIDVFGMQAEGDWVIAGVEFPGNKGKDLDLNRKPHIDGGVTLVGDGIGTNFDDTDWLFRSGKGIPNQDGEIFSNTDISNMLGFHEMDPVTKYMSTVSSLAYKVSLGFSVDELIRGVVDGTSVDAFMANIILSDPDQGIVLKGAAAKTGADVLVSEDTLVVTSKDLSNITKYVLEVTATGLNDDANLTAADGSGYVIDITGETGTVSGILYGTSIADALAGIEKSADAILNVIDADGNLLPMQVLNADTILVPTYVSTDVYFEVIAENGTTIITYNLVPISLASDAFVVSDVYAVDQDLMVISVIPGGTEVSTFLDNVVPVAGASIVLKDKAGFERTMGNISYDDQLHVTSEDAKVTVSYYLTFQLELYPDMSNTAPVVSIEVSSFNIEPAATISLTATATDDGNPVPSAITYLWEVISGDAGTVSIANPGQLVTDVTFNSLGTFELQLSVSDGVMTGTAVVTVVVAGVGVEGLNAAFVRAYPNPASEVLNIELGNNTGKANIRIIDITGQISYLSDHEDDLVKLDLAKFKPGIYFIFVEMENESFVNKVQIVK
ncbi:MAG: T9SS type A sorting domain-containing protein, partial [Bacteroidales bacterium]|nr:T9SS type A sorting domain-containing protein [Bacteroidales bacterium]